MHYSGVIGDEYRRLRGAKAQARSSMGSPPRDPYHNRSMEPRLSRDPPRESFNLMVVGEAGLGKTTLLESFFKSFKVRDRRVAAGPGLLHGRSRFGPGSLLAPLALVGTPATLVARSAARRYLLLPKHPSFSPADPHPSRLPHSSPAPPPPGRRRDLRPFRAQGDAQRHRDAPPDRGSLCAAHRVRA